MLVRYGTSPAILDDTNIHHSVTLVPRLAYSLSLLDGVIQILRERKDMLKESNKNLLLAADSNNVEKACLEAIKLEHTILFSFQVLSLARKKLAGISNVHSIPEILPSSIPMIRTVSAQLFDTIPHCSQKLSELSVHLGSIVLDSATLTKARFDFSQSNMESCTILDKIKSVVDSKLQKQYDYHFEKMH